MYALDFRLTHREQEVLHLVAEGFTDRRIAQSLIISPRTVNRHLSNIFVKLAVPCCRAALLLLLMLSDSGSFDSFLLQDWMAITATRKQVSQNNKERFNTNYKAF